MASGAGHVGIEAEAHWPGHPALERAAENAHPEPPDDQPGERADHLAVTLDVRDDRLGPLGAFDELEPLARLEDVARAQVVDRGVDPVQRHALER